MATATTEKATGKTGANGKAKAPAKGKKPVVEREKISFDVEIFRAVDGNPMNAATMKKLLGYTPESEDDKYDSNFVFKDENGDKVQLRNNDNNRPLHMAWVEQLAQDILTKNWQFNGETFVRGEYGNMLSGQHRGVALILAQQKWEKNPNSGYRQTWPEEPTIDCIVVHGISEDPKVKRTLDNTKPRTFADVLFADTGIFGKKTDPRKRSKLVRYVDTCVSFLWERLLRKEDAYEPRRTHSAALDFLAMHPHVLEAVKHIDETNGDDDSVALFISPGLAAGLMYLFGSSSSDPMDYAATDPKKEGTGKKAPVKWDNWDKAKEFWNKFVAKDKKLKGLFKALETLANNSQGRSATRDEKVAVFILAWNLYVMDKTVTEDKLKLEYPVNAVTGKPELATYPEVGPQGLDKGSTKDPAKKAAEQAERERIKAEKEAAKEVKKAEVEARKAEEKAKKDAARAEKKAKGESVDEDDEDDDDEDEEEEEMEEGDDESEESEDEDEDDEEEDSDEDEDEDNDE